MNRLLFALPLMLASCGNEPDVQMENASVGEVAKEMQKAGTSGSFITPGKWQQTVKLIEIDAPGMPAQAREMMRKAMGEVQQVEHCLTPEQAKRPPEDFFAKADQNCRYDHFNWGDGKIDLQLNCTLPQGSMTMVQTGEYRPGGYSMAVTQTISNAASAQPMVMKMTVDAKRVGDCDGHEKVQIGN